MQTIISNFLKDRKVFCIKDKYGFYIDCPFCKHRASSNEVQIYSNGDFFCKKCDVAYNWEDFCKQIYELNYGNIRRNFKQEYLDAVESKKKGLTIKMYEKMEVKLQAVVSNQKIILKLNKQ